MENYSTLYLNLVFCSFFLLLKGLYVFFTKPIFILFVTTIFIFKLLYIRYKIKDHNLKFGFMIKKEDIVVFILLVVFLLRDLSNMLIDYELPIVLYFLFVFCVGYFLGIKQDSADL